MNTAIRDFQLDQAILLQDRIAQKTREYIAVNRIVTLFVKHGVVSDYTLWAKSDEVLSDLGFAYDEIWEVAS